MKEMNIKQVQENTLKMIRNNGRYEDLIEELIKYSLEIADLELAKKIKRCLDSIEKYEGI